MSYPEIGDGVAHNGLGLRRFSLLHLAAIILSIPDMHLITARTQLSPNVTRLDVVAPRIAEIRQPGQFVIVRRGAGAERIPLTIADADRQAGTIALVIQSVGKSTRELVALQPGEPSRTSPVRWACPLN